MNDQTKAPDRIWLFPQPLDRDGGNWTRTEIEGQPQYIRADIAAAPDMRDTIRALCDEVERLRAENERFRGALKPFADEAVYWFCHNYNREDRPVEGFSGYQPVMTCGDLFNARAALAQKGGE